MDGLEESEWTNVQDPVRQMFTALTKAVRTQSAGIRDLDRKVGHFVTKDSLDSVVSDLRSKSCSKEDATDIMRHIETKASADVVNNLDSKLNKVRVFFFFKSIFGN